MTKYLILILACLLNFGAADCLAQGLPITINTNITLYPKLGGTLSDGSVWQPYEANLADGMFVAPDMQSLSGTSIVTGTNSFGSTIYKATPLPAGAYPIIQVCPAGSIVRTICMDLKARNDQLSAVTLCDCTAGPQYPNGRRFLASGPFWAPTSVSPLN